MARYIFSHCGTRPVITPNLPSPLEVEAWAQKNYGYATDEAWRDIAPDEPLTQGICEALGFSGDPDVDFPVRRTLCDEDWYVGPIEVLETTEKTIKVPLTLRELDLLLEDLGARVHEMLDHLDELNDEEEEFAMIEGKIRMFRAQLEQDDDGEE